MLTLWLSSSTTERMGRGSELVWGGKKTKSEMNPSWEVIRTKMRRNHRDDLFMYKSWPTSLSGTELRAYRVGVNGKMCTKCDQNRKGECGRLITQNERERGTGRGKQRDRNIWDSKEKKVESRQAICFTSLEGIQGLGTHKVGLREICTLNQKWLL